MTFILQPYRNAHRNWLSPGTLETDLRNTNFYRVIKPGAYGRTEISSVLFDTHACMLNSDTSSYTYAYNSMVYRTVRYQFKASKGSLTRVCRRTT